MRCVQEEPVCGLTLYMRCGVFKGACTCARCLECASEPVVAMITYVPCTALTSACCLDGKKVHPANALNTISNKYAQVEKL